MITIRQQIPFLIIISYFTSFLLIRVLVIIAGSAQGLSVDEYIYIGRNIILFGYHIHHFYFGFAMICYAAWVAIVHTEKMDRKLTAVIFGAGLGLFMDEIGMLLSGVYYSRLTFVISSFLAILLLIIVFFPHFWESLREELKRSSSGFAVFLMKHDHFLKVADYVSKKTGRTERVSLTLSGVIFLSIGLLILFYPQFVYYWVAGGFIIQGVSSFIRAWYVRDMEEAREEYR